MSFDSQKGKPNSKTISFFLLITSLDVSLTSCSSRKAECTNYIEIMKKNTSGELVITVH